MHQEYLEETMRCCGSPAALSPRLWDLLKGEQQQKNGANQAGLEDIELGPLPWPWSRVKALLTRSRCT